MPQDGMNAVDEGISMKSDRIAQKVLQIQQKLENALAMQRAYVAPVRRVPVEVLEMIFELSCEDATIDPSDCTPLALSAVCRLWRRACFAKCVSA